MTAPVLMVQGTASSVGKSLLVAALCRILRQDGLRVAPFKAQNMSNNSYVTADGGEMGRAQVNQAEAAGIEPSTDMNPILLKPESDHRAQVVLNGRPYLAASAGKYFALKQTLWPEVTAALDRLRSRYDAVVIEGAGSPAEINLRERDIVNMRVARHAQAPVLLVGDIDRGGVFAHLVGTLALLTPEELHLMRALVINKFRGDRALLAPGLAMLEERTGLPVAGVVPFLHDVALAEEDAAVLESPRCSPSATLDIAVVRLPHISNFDDFDPLALEAGVGLRFVSSARALGLPDLVVLPGSKATVADLAWMRNQGLDRAVVQAARSGAAVIGICGGFQMLGDAIADPDGVESRTRRALGLGLLACQTTFHPAKATHRVEARVAADRGLLAGARGLTIGGYEIHMGETAAEDAAPFQISSRSGRAVAADDGAASADGWVLGTYLHGLFANDGLRAAMLANLAARKGVLLPSSAGRSARQQSAKEAAYNRLAADVRAAIDMRLIHRLLEQPASRVCITARRR